jgi:hypothetical protein
MGNSPIALEIAITARENSTARTMIELENIFLGSEFSRASLDPVHQ